MKEANLYESSRENVAAFTNTFIQSFWANLSLQDHKTLRPDTEAYFALNRALADTIRKHIVLFNQMYTIDREMFKRMGEDYSETYARNIISHSLVDFLLKDQRIPLEKSMDFATGLKEYALTLPVVVIPQEEK